MSAVRMPTATYSYCLRPTLYSTVLVLWVLYPQTPGAGYAGFILGSGHPAYAGIASHIARLSQSPEAIFPVPDISGLGLTWDIPGYRGLRLP